MAAIGNTRNLGVTSDRLFELSRIAKDVAKQLARVERGRVAFSLSDAKVSSLVESIGVADVLLAFNLSRDAFMDTQEIPVETVSLGAQDPTAQPSAPPRP